MLQKILEKFTGKRYQVEKLNWTTNSLVSNIFRAWEFVAGRKVGIRLESVTSHRHTDKGVLIRTELYTVEAHLVFMEAILRKSIANIPKFVTEKQYKENPFALIRGISIATLGMSFFINADSLIFPIIMGAIAYENKGSATASNTATYTYSIPVSGADNCVFSGQNIQNGDLLTSLSVDSVAANFIMKSDAASAGFYGYNYLYYKQNVAVGTVDVDVTASGAGWVRGSSSVYSGVNQYAPVGNGGAKNINSTSNSLAIINSMTNAWGFSWYMQDSTASSNGTPPSGWTQRSGLDSTQADSNGSVSVGDLTWTWGVSGTNRSTQLAVTIQPEDGERRVLQFKGDLNDYNNTGTVGSFGVKFIVLNDVTVDNVGIYATRGNGASGTFKIGIYSGSPAIGTLVAETSTMTTTSNLPAYGSSNLAWSDFDLTTPASLVKGTTYYLIVTAVTGSSSDEIRLQRDTTSGACMFGQTSAGIIGSSWTDYAGYAAMRTTAQAAATSQIKSIVGTVIASVKSVSGTAIASIKSIAGTSNT